MLSTHPVCTHSTADSSLERDLVIISSDLKNYQFLAESVYPHMKVRVLDSSQEGIDAIAQVLMTLQPVCRLHLITPGTPGRIWLGNTSLRHADLPDYANALCCWRSHLTPEAAILIYNDQIAHTEAGKLLIDVLHHLTGAAIAACIASPNKNFRKGRWELDCATQSFTPSLAFPPSVVAACLGSPHPNHFLGSLPQYGNIVRQRASAMV